MLAQSTFGTPTITTVAGRMGVGDFGPAVNAALKGFATVSEDGQGRTLLASSGGMQQGSVVRRIALDGTISVVAGNGYTTMDSPVTGVNVLSVALPRITEVLGLEDGSFLIAGGHSVLKVRTDGIIVPFANAVRPDSLTCDNVPDSPTTLYVCNVSAMTLGPNGTVYIADSRRYRVYAVSANETVTHVAGNGSEPGAAANINIPATQAAVNPRGVAFSNGSLYLAEPTGLHRIDSTGLFTLVQPFYFDPLPVASGVSPEHGDVHRVLGSRANGDIIFENRWGVMVWTPGGTADLIAGRRTATADPIATTSPKEARFNFRRSTMGINDSVVIAEPETGEVYRASNAGVLTHIAGRRPSATEPANSLSLLYANGVSTGLSGNTLVVEGGRVWRYAAGTFTLVAGALRYSGAYPQFVENESAFRSMLVDGAIEGCNGDVYVWGPSPQSGGAQALRVDATGKIHLVTMPTPGPATSIGGFCGNIYATADYKLFTIGTDDTATLVTGVSPSKIIGADETGTLYLELPSPSFSTVRRTSEGTITTLVSMAHTATTRDGFAGLAFGYFGPHWSLLRFRSGALENVTRVSYDVPPPHLPNDGPLGGVAVGITAVAGNAPTSSILTVLDRGLLRLVDLDPTVVRAVAPQATPVAPQPRTTAPIAEAAIVSPRSAAPQTG